MVVGFFVIAVEKPFTVRPAGQQQLDEMLQKPPRPPRSGPPAAPLVGGSRPGSLRVHDPCNEMRHGSRLGFPARRQPRGPAAPGNVARGLQVLLPWRDLGQRVAEAGDPAARRRIYAPLPPS